jgi:hypothetical protein
MLIFPGESDTKNIQVTMELTQDGDLRVRYNNIVMFSIIKDSGRVIFYALYTREVKALKELGVDIDDATSELVRC